MDHKLQEKLLSDKRVIDEIQRHCWIESERAGHNVGFDQAKEDWLKRFSKTWMEYHMPEELTRAKAPAVSNAVAESVKEQTPSKAKAPKVASAKRRRAKSYI